MTGTAAAKHPRDGSSGMVLVRVALRAMVCTVAEVAGDASACIPPIPTGEPGSLCRSKLGEVHHDDKR